MAAQENGAGASALAELTDLAEAMTEGWPGWAQASVTLGIAVGVALLVHAVAFWIASRWAARTKFEGDEAVVRRMRAPMLLLLPLMAVLAVRPGLSLPEGPDEALRRLLAVLTIVAATWATVRLIGAVAVAVMRKHRVDVPDNLEARRVHTQLRVIARILSFVVVIVGASAILMTFPSVRQLGASLLASAGIAGLVIGLAAQRVLGNFIAGLQIALTGPIHLDDVVVIDGEWGRIEEIATTYVVVRIWDERRLIVPLSRIIEQPFQNWTRRTSQVLGTAFVHADYAVPVQRVREELERIARESPLWDGRLAKLQVTDAKDRTLELRALVSAGDASKAWDLRCEVRERLIDFIRREFPHCLPRVRTEISGEPGASSAAAAGAA